jgi:hypothetical protein
MLIELVLLKQSFFPAFFRYMALLIKRNLRRVQNNLEEFCLPGYNAV